MALYCKDQPHWVRTRLLLGQWIDCLLLPRARAHKPPPPHATAALTTQPAELEEACEWSWAELESCMRALRVTYRRSPHSALTVIKGRYEKAERNGVANLAPPMNFDNMTWD